MNKHTFIVFLITLAPALSRAQETEFIQIKDPIVDNELTIQWYTALLAPMFILNENYLIFQKDNYPEQRSRKTLNADMTSLRFPRGCAGLFALDKNGVYYQGIFLKVDTTGFEIVGYFERNSSGRYYQRNYYWKTKERVFLNVHELDDIDAASFQLLELTNGPYFRDKNYIYYRDQKINGSDPNSACDYWAGASSEAYDKNYIYSSGQILTYNGDTLRRINDFLAKTSTKVIVPYHHYNVQPDIDVKTIKPLSRYYSMDKNFVYFKNEKTPIQPKNFNNVKVFDQVNSCYVSDGINLYVGSQILQSNLDAKTFGMIPFSDYVFDKNGIYEKIWENKKFPFSYTEEVSEKDIFWAPRSCYIIYKNQIYDACNRKLYTNLTTEQIDLVKDNKFILIDGKIKEIEKIFCSFAPLCEINNKVYYGEKETIADAQTLQWIPDTRLFKDKRYVYELRDWGKPSGFFPIKGVDLETVNSGFCGYFFADKNYIYWNHYRIIKNDKAELLAVFTNGGEGENPDYYLLKNSEGYWLLSGNRIRNLGNTLSGDIQKLLLEK